MTAPSPISMRERLRENYGWTPRQREVLDLMARGKTNTEIGEALGISLDGAKWHVSEILSKLQAESREEAAEYWRHYNGFAPRFSRVFRGVATGGAVKWIAGSAGVMVAAAAAAAIVAVAINQSSDEPTPANPPPVSTPVPGGPTSPAPIFNGQVKFNQPVKSIPGSTMYVVTGCTQCDGPDGTLQKVVTDASGVVTTTTILQSNAGPLTGWHITTIHGAPDASLLVAVISDDPNAGGVGPGGLETNFRVIVSTDGGTTWNDAFEHTGNYVSISNVTTGGFAAMTTVYEGQDLKFAYVAYRDGQASALTAPAAAGNGAAPVILRDGSNLWVSADYKAVYRQDGTPFPLTVPAGSERLAHVPISDLADGTLAIAWASVTDDLYYSEIVQITDKDGNVTATIDGNAAYFLRALDGQYAIGNVSAEKAGLQDPITNYPVLLDIKQGTATPVAADVFTEQRGRNRFIAFDPA